MASLLLGFLIWLMVMNIEDPIITRKINEIPIKTINNNFFEEKDKLASYTTEYVDVTIKGNKKSVDKLTKEDLIPIADMEQIDRELGIVPIELEIDNVEIVKMNH